jgi:ankyrin repeat protein
MSRGDEPLLGKHDCDSRQQDARVPDARVLDAREHYEWVKSIGKECLVTQPAVFDAIDKDDVAILATLSDQYEFMNAKGQTPLVHAVETNRLTCVRHLLDAKVNVNRVVSGARWALSVACYMSNPAMVRLLLERGADMYLVFKPHSYRSLSRGFYATCFHALLSPKEWRDENVVFAILSIMLEHGLDINRVLDDYDGV